MLIFTRIKDRSAPSKYYTKFLTAFPQSHLPLEEH